MLQQEEEERLRLKELVERQASEQLEKQARLEEERIRTDEQEKVGPACPSCCIELMMVVWAVNEGEDCRL